MTNPFAYIPRTDRPAVYHGEPAPYTRFSDRDIERRLLEHGAECEENDCPMLRHLRRLRDRRDGRGEAG
ncbi:hypothetical protein [Nocardia sp. NPDC005978]|uniref:hypothetical protein n=1 Tax=unclassified Nocardia TaxID=2637762 RepID=UPI0033A488D2